MTPFLLSFVAFPFISILLRLELVDNLRLRKKLAHTVRFLLALRLLGFEGILLVLSDGGHLFGKLDAQFHLFLQGLEIFVVKLLHIFVFRLELVQEQIDFIKNAAVILMHFGLIFLSDFLELF